MRILTLSLLLMCSTAGAQTLPFRLPQFVEPPQANGADAFLYPNGILYNPTLGCLAGAVAGQWPCLATDADVTAAQTAAVQQAATAAAATYLPRSEATTTVSALTTRVGAAEAAISALQAIPRLACTTFAVPTGFSVPLAGISSTISVPLAGVPVGTTCDTGAPSRMALGARPDPIVTAAGTVNMAFVSNGGPVAQIIAIPSGTYRLCCVL